MMCAKGAASRSVIARTMGTVLAAFASGLPVTDGRCTPCSAVGGWAGDLQDGVSIPGRAP
jgi:hypothetical protein